jgi:hypothetical protein
MAKKVERFESPNISNPNEIYRIEEESEAATCMKESVAPKLEDSGINIS